MTEGYEVFVSYSHDSGEHIEAVLEFSNRLRSEGVDCVLDQYESSPPEGWPRWMDRKIRECKYVLMVCTEPYFRRVMGEEKPGTGQGVKWEGNLIYQHLYDADTQNAKFIPVVMDSADRAFVPTPLRGSTVYTVGSPAGYEALYARLAELPSRRPPLGKKRPLPKLPVKTNPEFFVTSPIDVDLWNRAGWKGVFYGEYPHGVPILGLAFRDRAAAQEIFLGWRDRYGDRDLDEELRVSIVEGDVPGEEAGYSVHISTDLDVFIKRVRAAGFEFREDVLFSISRIHRMNPDPGSPHLSKFKESLRKAKTYYLVPGFISENGQLEMMDDLRIFKSKVLFRRVEDIGVDDIDSAVFRRNTDKPGRP